MSKTKVKTKDTVNLVMDSQARVPLRVEDQSTPLAKSVVLGAQLMEENEDLRARIEELLKQNRCSDSKVDEWQRKYARYGNELEYWKKHSRRVIGRWHLTAKVELMPWSWYWKPYWFRTSGVAQLSWLFLGIEALEA